MGTSIVGSTEVIANIPRLFTAVCEWAACLVFILSSKKRFSYIYIALISLGFLLAQCALQYFAGTLPIGFWIPGMICALGLMYLYVLTCVDSRSIGVGYISVRAFVLAEFAASLEWQLYYFFVSSMKLDGVFWENVFFLVICAPVFVGAYFLNRKFYVKGKRFAPKVRDFISATVIALVVFLFSNISFLSADTPFSGSLDSNIFYIRTLVDLCGIILLYTQEEQRIRLMMTYELDAMQNILSRQYDQYRQSRDNIELLNRKYHDLKHQISIIRAEENNGKREEYLKEMERGIKFYEAQNKTGNAVLDTILGGKSMVCAKEDINFTCVADGALLADMDVMDICSVFGNALDNAIECVERITDKEKRIMKMALYKQNDFMVARFENYYEGSVSFEGDLPKTTKGDEGVHGYGIKSIKFIAEKYGGSIKLTAADNWFTLLLLIPINK